MAFLMKSPVAMEHVPDPLVKTRASKYRELYDAICELKRETALPVEFGSSHEMEACRTALRKLAKRDGEFISTSRDRASFTTYFWMEPKGIADQIRKAKS